MMQEVKNKNFKKNRIHTFNFKIYIFKIFNLNKFYYIYILFANNSK